MNSRLLTFLRAYNDIDHIVPILYKWQAETDVPIDVVLTGPRELLDDYRLKFLGGFERVRIRHIDDVMPRGRPLELLFTVQDGSNALVSRFRRRMPVTFDRLRRLRKAARPRDLESKQQKKRRVAEWLAREVENRREEADRLIDTLMGDVTNGTVTLDWVTSPDARAVVAAARRRGFTTVSLPHGDEAFYNHMSFKTDMDYRRIREPEECAVYDYLVAPNPLSVEQWSRHPDLSRVKVLGSPRFNDEWLKIIDGLVPAYENRDVGEKLKVLLFLRDGGYPVFLEEVVMAVRLVLQFEGVVVVIKHHTRKRAFEKELSVLSELNEMDRVTFVGDDVHSPSLLKWADLVLDLGTSVCFEAVKKGIPVLSMDYLHANYSTLAHSLPSGEMKCRDHLYDAVSRLLEGGSGDSYVESERSRFIAEFIDFPDGHVLERYVRFLRDCLGPADERCLAEWTRADRVHS